MIILQYFLIVNKKFNLTITLDFKYAIDPTVIYFFLIHFIK
jgi:hypothetical protein